MKKFEPIKLEGVTSYSLKDRLSVVNKESFGKAWTKNGSLKDFIVNLPDILAAKDFKEIISLIANAKRNNKIIVFSLGAHVVKVGLNPIIIDLMERRLITAIALNGAGIIHDSEIALVGHTSEDVSREIVSGSFGMAEETALMINDAIKDAMKKGWGISETMNSM